MTNSVLNRTVIGGKKVSVEVEVGAAETRTTDFG